MSEDANVVRREGAGIQGLTSQELDILLDARAALLAAQLILSESLSINLCEDPGATIIRCATAQLKIWIDLNTPAQREQAQRRLESRRPALRMAEN